MAIAAEAAEAPVPSPTPPSSSGTPRPVLPPVSPRPVVPAAAAAATTAEATATATAATATRTGRVRNFVIPPWRGAARGNTDTATAPTQAAAVVNRTDTVTPPPPITAPEAARPSPTSTTDALPTLEEEPRARESRTATVRTFVIPPWRGAARDNSATAAARTRAVVVDCPDTVATPPPPITAPEAARPSPISTTDARPTLEEEPRARESRAARVRAYVIPPWRDNSATAATATPATAAVVNRTDTATPPPTTTASEAARPSPISTAAARPTLEEEPRARESGTASVRIFVIPPWRGAARDNSATAAARTRAVVVDCPDTVATPPPAYTASEAARPSPISTADARPTLEEPRAIEARTTRLRNYVIPPWAGASRNNSATAATATAATATTATATAATAAVVNRTDTATPPLTTTASEAARPSPISTTDARPTTLEEPRARESRTARGVRTYVIPPWAGASRVNRTTAAAPPTRAGERQLTRGEAQAILDAADMAAAEEVVAANEAADAFAVAQAVAASESAGAPSETGSETGGRSAEGGGDGGRISLALHHRVRQARDRASSTSSEQVLGRGRDTETRLESGWRTDGDVRVGRGGVPRVQQGRRLRLASSSSEQTTVRASDAETELDSGSLTDVDERHIVLVQQDRVTLPRERAGSVSSEQATLRASDVDMELDSGSQTEGDEGGDGDGDGGGRVLLVQERVRLPRGRTTTRRSRNYARGNAKDDASSTAVAAVATESARRTQSCPPTLERPPPPPAAHAVDGEPGDAHTAASGSEVGEPTSPTTQAAATQTDMEEEEAPESPAEEVADAQTETEEEGVESPTAQQVAAEAETEEDDGEVAVEAEAEAEAGGVALGGSGGVSVFPIVREDPDAGAVAFRSDSCAECQSLVVDASAHRDAVGMKGKVSAGLNADRCRNCWRVVCDSCVGTFWARTMVPQMYTRDSDSHRMRVCKTCHCAMEMFRKSLLLGRVEEAMAAYGTGCVNLDTPYTTYHGELPVHCAAAGGNVVLLSWLVDELGCSLFVDEDLKKPLRDLRNLTVLGAAAVNAQVQTMRYLVNTKRCSLFEITHLPTMKKALEACLHVSPEAKFSLGARGSGSSGQQSTEITTDISLRADGERSSYVDRGGPIEVSTMFGAASAFDDEDDCCIVCFDNEVACTLVPCGHHCCCRDCAGRLNHCPVCRARITEMIKAIPV